MSIRKIKPMDPHRSGWCLKLPVSQWSQGEHDKCPRTFPAGDCLCPCDHVGERTLESRAMVPRPVIPQRPVKVEVKEEDDEE